VSNFRQLIADGVFADVGGLGTGNNLAIMPIANEQKVPQAFLIAGAPVFSSDQKANPWTIGWYPTYNSEGYAFGKLLASAKKPITIASLAQNDDVGEAYVDGLKEGIKGSQVKIAMETTYNVTDPTVDAQIAKLAATKADVFFSANSQTPLAAASLLKAQQLGWLPTVFLASGANSNKTVITPGHGEAYPAIYSTAFSKSPQDPKFANDPDIKEFFKSMEAYAPQLVKTMVPHCVWGYQIGATLDAAFKAMKAPTRAALMEAIHGIKDLAVPMMLPGITVDATSLSESPVSKTQVQKFVNGSYVEATSFDG
jgi:branched-chain amino acid transport system substrate-binding protein